MDLEWNGQNLGSILFLCFSHDEFGRTDWLSVWDKTRYSSFSFFFLFSFSLSWKPQFIRSIPKASKHKPRLLRSRPRICALSFFRLKTWTFCHFEYWVAYLVFPNYKSIKRFFFQLINFLYFTNSTENAPAKKELLTKSKIPFPKSIKMTKN